MQQLRCVAAEAGAGTAVGAGEGAFRELGKPLLAGGGGAALVPLLVSSQRAARAATSPHWQYDALAWEPPPASVASRSWYRPDPQPLAAGGRAGAGVASGWTVPPPPILGTQSNSSGGAHRTAVAPAACVDDGFAGSAGWDEADAEPSAAGFQHELMLVTMRAPPLEAPASTGASAGWGHTPGGTVPAEDGGEGDELEDMLALLGVGSNCV